MKVFLIIIVIWFTNKGKSRYRLDLFLIRDDKYKLGKVDTPNNKAPS